MFLMYFFLFIEEIEGTNFRECLIDSLLTKLVVCTTVNFLIYLFEVLLKVLGMLKDFFLLSCSSFHYYRGSITKSALASNNSSAMAQVEEKWFPCACKA